MSSIGWTDHILSSTWIGCSRRLRSILDNHPLLGSGMVEMRLPRRHAQSSRGGFGPTALILLGSVAFAILTGVPLGVLAANSPGSGWDKAGRGFAFIGHVIPIFILGFLLTLASYHAFGNIAAIRGGFQLIPASISLGWLIAAVVFWRTRTAMLEADADGQSGASRRAWRRPFKNTGRPSRSPFDQRAAGICIYASCVPDHWFIGS